MLIRLTHANPYPPRRSIGCRKRVVTQIHRPDRPEPPRPRHALAVPSPQPKATSQGSTAHPGRDGPGVAWEEQGVVHGVYWIQFCIANANLHVLRAGRKPPFFTCNTCGSTRSGRPDASFATNAPHATRPSNPCALRPASGSGLAILHRLPASVAIRSSQNRRS